MYHLKKIMEQQFHIYAGKHSYARAAGTMRAVGKSGRAEERRACRGSAEPRGTGRRRRAAADGRSRLQLPPHPAVLPGLTHEGGRHPLICCTRLWHGGKRVTASKPARRCSGAGTAPMADRWLARGPTRGGTEFRLWLAKSVQLTEVDNAVLAPGHAKQTLTSTA